MKSLTDIPDDNDDTPAQVDRLDHWSGEYGSDAREAYRPRLAGWILRIYSGAAGMPLTAKRAAPNRR